MTPDDLIMVLIQMTIIWLPSLYLAVRFGVAHAIKASKQPERTNQ